MIHTLTLNPAVDYLVALPDLQEGAVNRSLSEEARWGGKGINVSIVLSSLGVPSVIMGLLGGFTGHAIRRGLKEMGLRTDFAELMGGLTRINVKISVRGRHTEIHGAGPLVSPEAEKDLWRRLERLGQGDALVISGPPPQPLGDGFYARVVEKLSKRGAETILDFGGPPLELALRERPSLVKANLEILSELAPSSLGGSGDLAAAAAAEARKLMARGAGELLVSLGPDGALLVGPGKILKASPPPGAAIDPYGAGDSLLAGFLAGRHKGLGDREALRLGAAAGAATAFSPSLAEGPHIERLAGQVEVAEL
jgi:1-phosphofructokinase